MTVRPFLKKVKVSFSSNFAVYFCHSYTNPDAKEVPVEAPNNNNNEDNGEAAMDIDESKAEVTQTEIDLNKTIDEGVDYDQPLEEEKIIEYSQEKPIEESEISNAKEEVNEIKETEEKVQVEIETFKNNIEKEIKMLQQDLVKSIDIAKQDGKQQVEKSVEASKKKASIESDKIISDAKNKSKSISFKLDGQMKKQIMDIIFSGI